MKSILFVFRFAPVVCFAILSQVMQAQVTGAVFRDFNGNGVQDANEPLVPGVTVNVYDASNALCATAVTAGATAPNYSAAGCGTGPVRVEFIVPTSGICAASGIDFSALNGAVYGSAVQFVNGNSVNVNFALMDPNDYNTGTAGVQAYVSCYVSGDPLPSGSTSGSRDWFVGFPITNTGTKTPPSHKLDGSIIGATWGIAYSKQANKIFTSAFLKRHTGLGIMGSGGIYLLTPTATSFSVNQFYNMDANGHRTRLMTA